MTAPAAVTAVTAPAAMATLATMFLFAELENLHDPHISTVPLSWNLYSRKTINVTALAIYQWSTVHVRSAGPNIAL
jgi:hypothetical protein